MQMIDQLFNHKKVVTILERFEYTHCFNGLQYFHLLNQFLGYNFYWIEFNYRLIIQRFFATEFVQKYTKVNYNCTIVTLNLMSIKCTLTEMIYAVISTVKTTTAWRHTVGKRCVCRYLLCVLLAIYNSIDGNYYK